MAPFSETRNFRSWWNSKTSLEQKLIVLSSLLFILSFCLVISVIVINNRKPTGGKTDLTTEVPTATPPTGETSPTAETEVTTNNATSPTPEKPTTAATTDPSPTPEEDKKDKKDDGTKDKDPKGEGEKDKNTQANGFNSSQKNEKNGNIADSPKLMTNPQMGFVH